MKKNVYQVPSIKVKELNSESLLAAVSFTGGDNGEGSHPSDPTKPVEDAKDGLFDNVGFDY